MKTLLLAFFCFIQIFAQDQPSHNRHEQEKVTLWGSNLNTIVVFIKFQGDAEFSKSRQLYDADFNAAGAASLKNFYNEVSYNKINISSYLYPVSAPTVNASYTFPKPRGYFMDYSGTNTLGYTSVRQARLREHEILDSALSAIKASVPSDLQFDFNSDGMVDNVMFIFQGAAGPWGDVGLWPHSGVLDSYDMRINGSRVYHYSVHLEALAQVSTYCHETFHVFGAPDLYRYFVNGNPVGSWDIMGTGNCHMGAYMKYKYTGKKWITDIPLISASGTYTLHPLSSDSNNCYRINTPYTNDEFFILEYRQKTGLYESSIPGSGLLVYRINSRAGDGNGGGPPDEIYIYRKSGTPTVGGSISQAYFSAGSGRTAINDFTTDPKSFLSNGAPAGLDIRNVGTAGNTITFDVIIVRCAIVSPLPNAVFSAGTNVPVKCITSDSSKIVKVDFFVNNTRMFTDSLPGYTFTWNTSGYAAGAYNIKTRAISSTGVYKEDSVQVFISAGNPVVIIQNISDSLKVGDNEVLTVSADASGLSAGIASVSLYIDNNLKGRSFTAPYAFSIPVFGLKGGKHTLRIEALDSLGNTGSSERTIFVVRYLLKEGFENQWPPLGWSVNSPTYGWYQLFKGAFAGAACAATRNYHASGEAWLATPVFVPDSTTTLEFFWLDNSLDITSPIAQHDSTYCEISVQGAPYITLAVLAAPDVEPQFHKQQVSLAPYKGKTVRVRWRDVSDESLEAMGTALDEVVATAMPSDNTGIQKDDLLFGKDAALLQNYPNPFNPATTIQYAVEQAGRTTIRIYDVLGNTAATLFDGEQITGMHQVQWDASRFPSGVYFCECSNAGHKQTIKLILMK